MFSLNFAILGGNSIRLGPFVTESVIMLRGVLGEIKIEGIT